MKESVRENGVPLFLISENPVRVEHVFREECPVPESNQGENYCEPDDIVGYHFTGGCVFLNATPKLLFLGLCRRIHLYY